ncbi:MAG: hypothetical protein HQK59_01720 [Deltaproteobacteria bacterium]|nr:hypothetical protein [Deltaproteobacteria bacterium]
MNITEAQVEEIAKKMKIKVFNRRQAGSQVYLGQKPKLVGYVWSGDAADILLQNAGFQDAATK